MAVVGREREREKEIENPGTQHWNVELLALSRSRSR